MNEKKGLKRDLFSQMLNYNLAFFDGGLIPIQWILDAVKGNYNFIVTQRSGQITCLVIDHLRNE